MEVWAEAGDQHSGARIGSGQLHAGYAAAVIGDPSSCWRDGMSGSSRKRMNSKCSRGWAGKLEEKLEGILLTQSHDLITWVQMNQIDMRIWTEWEEATQRVWVEGRQMIVAQNVLGWVYYKWSLNSQQWDLGKEADTFCWVKTGTCGGL